MSVVNGYRHKHPHTPFTVENIQPLGVAESIAPRTMQALRLLDLVDGDGNPLPAFDVLREATNAEFPGRLAEVLRAAYAEVFAYKDPAADDPSGMNEVFRFYKPPSMQPRMIRLFYGLCAQAGIIESAPAVERSGKSASRKSPTPRGKATEGKAATRTTPAPAPAAQPAAPPTAKPELIAALWAKLPSKGSKMTADEAKWWLTMMQMAMPQEYGFDPPPEWSQ